MVHPSPRERGGGTLRTNLQKTPHQIHTIVGRGMGSPHSKSPRPDQIDSQGKEGGLEGMEGRVKVFRLSQSCRLDREGRMEAA